MSVGGLIDAEGDALRAAAVCSDSSGLPGEMVRFDWFTFSHEGVHPDDEGEMCRVYYGKRTRTETLGKREAAADSRFAVFFNVRGHFKQLSVIDRRP